MALSILERLGLVRTEAAADAEPALPEILAIADRLEDLDPGRAHFVALFAIVLARTARADLEISDDERRAIVRILSDLAELPVEQAELVGEMVARRREVFGSISFVEEEEVRQIAGELGLSSEHVDAARTEAVDPGIDREAR